MKVPDKIYFEIDENGKVHTYFGLQPENAVEYIRKDALLDYLHQRVEELNWPLNGVFGSTERGHCNERISELLLLMDKLNEM